MASVIGMLKAITFEDKTDICIIKIYDFAWWPL
jgi:hypothetical protein